MGGRILTHHSGGNDKNSPTGKPHLVGLTLFQDDEIERFVELQIRYIGDEFGAPRGRKFR